jgi:hypothetical protein
MLTPELLWFKNPIYFLFWQYYLAFKLSITSSKTEDRDRQGWLSCRFILTALSSLMFAKSVILINRANGRTVLADAALCYPPDPLADC